MEQSFYSEENSEYLKNNPSWHAEDSSWKAKKILKILSDNSINPKSVTEVGCGAGEILNQLHLSMPNDVKFVGHDISIDAIRIANERKKDRLEFRHLDFLETTDLYDLLLMIDVFEHVENYLGFLKACRQRAKNAVFHIPLDITVDAIMRNKLMVGRKYVGHLHYFTKETALATLRDSGYEIVDYFYTPGPVELPRFRSTRAYIPSNILYKINRDLTVKLLSGFSLLVLTK